MIGLIPTMFAQNELRRGDINQAEIEVYNPRMGGNRDDGMYLRNGRKRSSFPNDTSENNSKDSLKTQDHGNGNNMNGGLGQF